MTPLFSHFVPGVCQSHLFIFPFHLLDKTQNKEHASINELAVICNRLLCVCSVGMLWLNA